MKGIRLDRLLVERGIIESREKARAIILEGNVLVDGRLVDKPGSTVKADASLQILKRMPYVSRGGLKLEGALKGFNIDPTGKVAMDVGASTGGFTDCLLQHGAKKVYAIDVGYGQFNWGLRNDTRVILLEKTNIRYLERSVIQDQVDIATIDVSFISLLKVIPKVLEFMRPGGEIIALIKPQFEVGRKDVNKGVVRDEGKRLKAVEMIKSKSEEMGLQVKGVMVSPIRGPKGNIEYFIYLQDSRGQGAKALRA
jgi:23S rRNA (cytidine1920-2'-O)/16S rRNA (cytidine1409-2'-O)-methyltransferase